MNRKQFMQQQGATCSNWQWSWSFKNEGTKTIYFGAWENERVSATETRIFSLNWESGKDSRGKWRRGKGYGEAERNIELILAKNYKLMTFPMTQPKNNEIRIRTIVPEVTEKFLTVRGTEYFASSVPEINNGKAKILRIYLEGAKREVVQSLRERSQAARKACLDLFGFSCRVCDFNFEEVYGNMGSGYIHVHHLQLFSEKDDEHEIDPFHDLRPLCPNCHAMVHTTNPPRKINELREELGKPQLDPPE